MLLSISRTTSQTMQKPVTYTPKNTAFLLVGIVRSIKNFDVLKKKIKLDVTVRHMKAHSRAFLQLRGVVL